MFLEVDISSAAVESLFWLVVLTNWEYFYLRIHNLNQFTFSFYQHLATTQDAGGQAICGIDKYFLTLKEYWRMKLMHKVFLVTIKNHKTKLCKDKGNFYSCFPEHFLLHRFKYSCLIVLLMTSPR